MGLKKNYFKHLEHGVNTPTKQTDSRNPMNQDYKDAIAAGRNVDPRLVGRLGDPKTAEEYYGSFDINPNLELSEPSYLDKGVKFLYDNPIIGKIASKLPIARTLYKKGTEYMMNKSGGMGGGFTDRELYNPEDEAAYKEEENALKKDLDAGTITEDEYNKEMSYIRPEAYTGSDQVGWKDSDQNIVKHYLDGSGNLKRQNRYSPKSDDYFWQDTYSLKGDEFDKNLDRIDDTSGYQGITEDKHGNVKDKPLQTYRENFPNVVEQVMANTEDVGMLHPDDIIDSESGYTDKYNKTINNSFSDLFGGKTFFGTGAENAQLTRSYLGADLGGMRAGLGADGKLPYMSVWDSYDFQAHGDAGWNKKWAHTSLDETNLHPSDADSGKRDYMQAQLLNRASRDLGGKGGFKIYDRFYFHPDKYKDYIKDDDVEFMKEFYNIAHAGDEQSQWTQPVEINVSKKEEEKTPGTTKFETLKIGQ
jgi:hypothetical protein